MELKAEELYYGRYNLKYNALRFFFRCGETEVESTNSDATSQAVSTSSPETSSVLPASTPESPSSPSHFAGDSDSTSVGTEPAIDSFWE